MTRNLRLLPAWAFATVLFLSPPTQAGFPPTYEAAGIVLASSALCGHPPAPAAVSVTLVETLIEFWVVEFRGASLIGCPVDDVASCVGFGDFFQNGIDIFNCQPLGGSGKLGPFEPPLPCVTWPCPQVREGPIHFATALGTFDGTVKLVHHN